MRGCKDIKYTVKLFKNSKAVCAMIFFHHSSPFSSSVARLRTPKRGSIGEKIAMARLVFEFLNNFCIFSRLSPNKLRELQNDNHYEFIRKNQS